MGEVKELNIKNRTYYYFVDMTDIKNFYSDLLKIGKKSHRGFDIYYIGYNMIKKLSNCNCNCNCDCDYENICSVNSLYLIIHSATKHFKEKYDEKYLILDSTEEHKEVSSGIKSGIETINDGKELFYKKNYARIGVNTGVNTKLSNANNNY